MRYLVVLLLVGCATVDPRPFRGPNGRQAYSMECSGGGRTLGACYEAAGKVCPRGYNVIASPTGTGAAMISGTMVAAPRHGLIVECR